MFTVAKVGCRDNGGGGQSGLLKATAMTVQLHGREAIHTYPFVFLPLLVDLVSTGCLSSLIHVALCIKGNTVNSRSRV